MTKREFAEYVYENLGHNGMEAILYTDGSFRSRQSGSTGTYEDEIVANVPLSFHYWSDSWFFNDLYEYDPKAGERVEKEITDSKYKRDIILGIYIDIFHHGFYDYE